MKPGKRDPLLGSVEEHVDRNRPARDRLQLRSVGRTFDRCRRVDRGVGTDVCDRSVMIYHTVPPRAVPLCNGRVTVLATKSTAMALDRTTLARGSAAAAAGVSVAANAARMRAEVKRFICDIVRGGRALRCTVAYIGDRDLQRDTKGVIEKAKIPGLLTGARPDSESME